MQRSLASLASSLVVATPTDALSPVSAFTRARTATAISGPVPWRRRDPSTSRNASSREMGSTSGVNDLRIAMISVLASR